MTVLFGEETAQRRAMSSHQRPSGGQDEWLTPPPLVQSLGPFDLDPCAPLTWPTGVPPTATRCLSIADDGLRQEWQGMVWLNPPYSTAARWVARLAAHGHGIALLFARTETQMWSRHVWPHASSVLFPRGRLHFHHSGTGVRAAANAGAPSALVAYGTAAARRLAESNIAGALVRTVRSTP